MCPVCVIEGGLHRKRYRTNRGIVLNHIVNWLRSATRDLVQAHVPNLFAQFIFVARKQLYIYFAFSVLLLD
jgi:hypothetical protein